MLNPAQIEDKYQEFVKNLPSFAHDGIINIDLKFLHDQGLVTELSAHDDTDDLSQYFHVIESVEKVTLFNEQFIVWILPRMEGEQPFTYVLIALNHPDTANLEVVFATHGVYNTPRYVLKVLQHFLIETLETEETITLLKKNQ